MLPRFHPRHLLRRWPERRPFDPSLVAYYSGVLGSGSVLYDETIYGNHGTIYGATWAEGKIRPALSFDGVDNYITVPSHASLNPTEEVTILAWIYPTKIENPVILSRAIVRKSDQYSTYVLSNTGKVLSFITTDATLTTHSGDTVLALNTCYHVAFTYDGSYMRIYVNGVLDSTPTAKTGAIKTSTELLYIGKNAGYAEYFQGIIDEVHIYNRALSEAEILRHYLRLA